MSRAVSWLELGSCGSVSVLPVNRSTISCLHVVDVERGMALEQIVWDLAPVLLKDGRGGLGERFEILSLIHV